VRERQALPLWPPRASTIYARRRIAAETVSNQFARKNPAVIQIDTTSDLFAVGDVQSDYVHLVRALDAAEIIAGKPEHPEQVRWRGGRAVLISRRRRHDARVGQNRRRREGE
jgi:hypothetical protein